MSSESEETNPQTLTNPRIGQLGHSSRNSSAFSSEDVLGSREENPENVAKTQAVNELLQLTIKHGVPKKKKRRKELKTQTIYDVADGKTFGGLFVEEDDSLEEEPPHQPLASAPRTHLLSPRRRKDTPIGSRRATLTTPLPPLRFTQDGNPTESGEEEEEEEEEENPFTKKLSARLAELTSESENDAEDDSEEAPPNKDKKKKKWTLSLRGKKKKKKEGRIWGSRSQSVDDSYDQSDISSSIDGDSESGLGASWSQSAQQSDVSETEESESTWNKLRHSLSSRSKKPHKRSRSIFGRSDKSNEETIIRKNTQIHKANEVIIRLDACSLDELTLMMMLICPGDDSPNDYTIRYFEKAEMPYLRLERNSDCATFIKPMYLGKLQLVCFLFCLDNMLTPVHPTARKHFLDFNHSPFRKLFEKLKGSKLTFEEGNAEYLYVTRKKLQRALSENSNITKLELLNVIDPGLYAFYRDSIASDKDLDMRHYSLISDEHLAPTKIRVAGGTEELSTTEQLEALKKIHDEWQKTISITKDLRQGNTASFAELTFNSCREEVINHLIIDRSQHKKSLPQMLEKRKNNEPLQAALTHCLTQIKFLPTNLVLAHWQGTEEDVNAFLKMNGGQLVNLDLSHCPGVTDSTINSIFRYCQNLRSLKLCHTKVRNISGSLTLTHLDLSSCKVNDMIFQQVHDHCPDLQSLVLCGTLVTTINRPTTIRDLDLSGCKDINAGLLDAIKRHCRKLKSLALRGTTFYSLDLDTLGHLEELDLRDCPKLERLTSKLNETNTNGGDKSKNSSGSGSINSSRGGSKLKLTASYRLRILRVDGCQKLTEVTLPLAHHLVGFHANNCGNLLSAEFADDNLMHSLAIVEVENCSQLRTLVANGAAVIRFIAFGCVNLASPLNDQFCRQLLLQVAESKRVRISPTKAGSAWTTLARVKPDYRQWAYQELGKFVFNENYIEQGNFTGLSLAGVDAFGTTWKDCILDSDLSNLNAYNCAFQNCSFGQLAMLKFHESTITAIAHSRDGELMASADQGGTVIVQDNQSVLHRFRLNCPIYTLAFSGDNKLAIAGTVNDFEKLDRTTADEIFAGVNPQDKKIVTRDDRHQVIVFDLAQLQEQQQRQEKSDQPTDTRSLPLAFNCTHTHSNAINRVLFSPDNRLLISCSEDGKIKVRDIKANKMLGEMNKKIGVVTDIALNKNKVLLACTYENGSICIWNIRTFGLIKQWQGHDGAANCVNFSHDGKLLVTGGDDHKVKRWKIGSWRCELELDNVDSMAEHVMFSPDNKWIVASNSDHEAKEYFCATIWDAQTGRVIKRLKHAEPIGCIAIHPSPLREGENPEWLVLTGSSEVIRRWRVMDHGLHVDIEREAEQCLLNAKDADFEDVEGLTLDDQILLCQLQATGNTLDEVKQAANKTPASPEQPREPSQVYRGMATQLGFMQRMAAMTTAAPPSGDDDETDRQFGSHM